MKSIFRNFISVIRRYSLATALNILGLSVAFAAFMVIMIQLDYDFGFDKCHKDYDKIFRLEVIEESESQVNICRPLAELFLASSPHIVAGAVTFGSESIFFHIESEGVKNFYEEKSERVSPEFTDVFTFDITEGVQDALKTPEHVLIPLSLSRKLFGNESAVGRQLVAKDGSSTVTVGAVYRDFPANTILTNCIFIPLSEDLCKHDWSEWSFVAYFRVNDASNVPLLFDNFKRNFDAPAVWGQDFDWDEGGFGLRFTNLADIHYVMDVEYDRTPKASKSTLLILFAIALMMVAIAGINFTNFSTALAPMRIKSINTQRILGARLTTQRLSIVSEAVIISLLAFFIAIGLVALFRATPLSRLADADLSVAAHPLIVGGTALVALISGLLAGLYPSFYMTSFEPAWVINGSFGLSPKGRKLRNALISTQYIASFALIIGASFMYLQNHFMQHSPLGYDKEALITVNTEQIRKSRKAFTDKVKAYSGVEDITYGERILSSSDYYMGWGQSYKGEQINFHCIPVDYMFLKVMGIGITEGRDFREEDANRQHGTFVFNETAHKKFDLEIGSTIGDMGEIVGFMPDIKFASFRKSVEPMAFFVWGTKSPWGDGSENMSDRLRCAYIKLKAGANRSAAIAHIRATLAEFDPDYPFEVRFFDEVLQRLYEKERSLGSLISLFSLLAIFISIVGVFGLVVFDSECRRKEIGIRKVHGSSVSGIILMFNKAYLYILLICFVVAAPLAWYAVSLWLENFAYKTQMYGWVYLLAFAVVGVITAATVTFQNWRVANENPVNSIGRGLE